MQSRGLNGFLDTGSLFKKQKRSLSRSSSRSSLSKNFKSTTSILNKKKQTQNNNSEESDYQTPSYRRQHGLRSIVVSQSKKAYSKHISRDQAIRANREDTSQFSASRKQLKDYLGKLSHKLKMEIGNVMANIDLFNRNIKKTVESQYQKIQQMIRDFVEEIANESRHSVIELVKQKTQILTEQIRQIKQQLQSMHSRVRDYQRQLEGIHWKKTMGELIETDIQVQINELIDRSQRIMNFRNFKLDLENRKISAFESCLRNLLQVKVVLSSNQQKLKHSRRIDYVK